MKSFQLLALLLLMCLPLIASDTGDSLAGSVREDTFSFKEDAPIGVGLFAGPFSGAGISLRLNGASPKEIGSQFTGYFFTSGKGESAGSIGCQLLLPIRTYNRLRFMATAGIAYFSDASSKFRIGAGVLSEWLSWSRLGFSIGLDVITIYDDGTVLVPFVSGGMHIYF